MSPKSPNFVSCLCVTEDRQEFLPWLLWGFQRQRWAERELVIVTGSDVPDEVAGAENVRIVPVSAGTSVPEKRNVALENAHGDAVAWFDDDDWQHPDRLTRIVEALQAGASVAGVGGGWFVDLRAGKCAQYRARSRVLFNGAGFRGDVARATRFDERRRRASDTGWLRAIDGAHRRKTVVLPGDEAFFWLCHDTNLSNPARRRRFPTDLSVLRQRLGQAWGDTDAQLERLRAAVGGRHRGPEVPPRVPRQARHRPTQTRKTRACAGASRPPVAAVVKISALDVPYAGATIPHFLRQAKTDFADRILVVDRRSDFRGKYRSRSVASVDQLDALCEMLVRDKVVDRIVGVDDDREHQGEILARYFDGDDRVPAYAHTGGPIYATLLGLESAPCDHVVQFDCDMLFHSSGESWVDSALRVLEADPAAWLAMTHGGPPGGELGTPASLGRANARRARWDRERGVWRFPTASTRYFLTDRRRLRGRLRRVPVNGGCAPLEMCISDALRRHGASRICVALPGSWDLHPHSHETPFPEWAERIAAAVERGDVPASQRGKYDLRLDRSGDRAAWSRLLERNREPSSGGGPTHPPSPRARQRPARSVSTRVRARAQRAQRPIEAEKPRDVAPIAVVIPIRDRAGDHLRRCLASVQWQTVGRPFQTIVVSHGSCPEISEELAALCDEQRAALVEVGSPADPWCKPLALNVGIRATDPALAFVMAMDGDMILAPNFLETVLGKLREKSQRMVLCRSSDLPCDHVLPSIEQIPSSFAALQRRTRLRGRQGCGGIQAAPRSFFFEVHGYDEDFVWWGAEDRDMLDRARRFGLEPTWITKETAMLHQWHVGRHRDKPEARAEIEEAARRNHALWHERASMVIRNPNGWGQHVGAAADSGRSDPQA